MEDVKDDGRVDEHKGKRFNLTAAERRCLELQLAPVERMRAEAARLELRALLEVRAFAVERLGLPEDSPIRLIRQSGVPKCFEVVESSGECTSEAVDKNHDERTIDGGVEAESLP